MSISGIANVVLTFLIISVCYYFANKFVRNSQQRDRDIIENGTVVYATILSMRQNGVFINNNPVVEMKLRVEDPGSHKKWLIEKHDETVLLIALDSYQPGGTYHAKLDEKNNTIIFVTDSSGKPISVPEANNTP
ncbi:hypothetical protein CBH50_004590 [Salmonella enterica subsp. diarizonae serovar 60:r:e,n,x,z15]|nr:hypothetical protein [Salmonella enterica subsp. diarizonae serovar 60:r:e,n,x,z15]